ncbi:hypothetical protein OM960_24795 [Defluviimonas sp. CAU 1641]|uniref:Uncharacterized protein n=2 Tax=Defluviimonas salinarum TaxID=2992147 RepID=A0ABT3JAM8_9RHOB|nr:hypothetical protein [Defluviimonas salinarum]
MATGHRAIRAEKKLHGRLKRAFPESIIRRDKLAGALNVVSEIYSGKIEGEIHRLLDALEAAIPNSRA